MIGNARLAWATHSTGPEASRAPYGWLDPVLAVVALAVLEAEAVTSAHRRGPLALNVIAVAVMALAAIWRRRSPLAYLISVGLLADALSGGLLSLDYTTMVGVYVQLFPTYTIAAWADRRRAIAGLMVWIAGMLLAASVEHAPLGNLLAAITTAVVLWLAGRVIRSWRKLSSDLKEASVRLNDDREDQWHLAIARERMSIARDVHAVVAKSVITMIEEARAAQQSLETDPDAANAIMLTMESIGRNALAEMRRTLGVLRHSESDLDLELPHGFEQLHSLVERARDRGASVELHVSGSPRSVPIGVDVGVYRILEEALSGIGDFDPQDHLAVSLTFANRHLEFTVDAKGTRPTDWPTLAMEEWIGLCGGELRVAESVDGCSLMAQVGWLREEALA
jgi:signal transduction histidine kinase